jgi:L-cysteine S-thiosulfotransferase
VKGTTQPVSSAILALALPATLAMGLAACAMAPQSTATKSDAAPNSTPKAADTRRSGKLDMSATLQALQDDPISNPARLSVAEGASLWKQADGAAQRSCQSCHGDAAQSMARAAAQHPKWDTAHGLALTLNQRIQSCQTKHQQDEKSFSTHAWSARIEDKALSLQAYLVDVARNQPIEPSAQPAMKAVREEGKRLYQTRMGQIDLSCADCHDDRAGLRLSGSIIPQAHPTGYPVYRLQWQSLGTLERRLRTCMTGVRAQPWPTGDAAWVALEAYLMARAAGMPLESAAVRP